MHFLFFGGGFMTKYYEILRLYHLGISQRGIATSLSCSRNTVSKTIKRFHELSLTWPLDQEYSDKELYHLLFEKPE